MIFDIQTSKALDGRGHGPSSQCRPDLRPRQPVLITGQLRARSDDRARERKDAIMTDSQTFDKTASVKRFTDAGFEHRTAEAIADEYAYVAALLRGEQVDPPPTRAD